MSKPLISVLLPVRDGGDRLDTSVRSILGQTETNLELLLIDDHSVDGAILRLGIDDPRLRLMVSEGQGIVAALNTGLKRARGDYIARMDADDISLPRRFSTQRDYLEANPKVAIAGAQVEIFSSAGVAGGFRRYQDWINSLLTPSQIRRELFIECPLPHPSFFMRQSALQSLGGYRDSPWAEDYDLLLRADCAGYSMGKPESVLLRWQDSPQRLSRTAERYGNEQFLLAKAQYLPEARLHGRDVVIWGAGPTGRRLHDALVDKGVNCLAFLEVHPRRIGGYKRGKPVLHFEQASEFSKAVVLVAVGVPSAREEIRSCLGKDGRVEGDDFLFVA